MAICQIFFTQYKKNFAHDFFTLCIFNLIKNRIGAFGWATDACSFGCHCLYRYGNVTRFIFLMLLELRK